MNAVRPRSKFAAIMLGVALAAGVLAITTSAGGLVPPGDGIVSSVEICHATRSNSNPYVINEPAADGNVSGHAGHTGQVWEDVTPTLKQQGIQWGDIIPPFNYDGGSFAGLNWDAAGQAIYANDCEPVEPPAEVFGSLAVTKVVVPPAVNPTGDLPSGFTVHVECDDGTSVDVTFPAGGGAGSPAQIDDIEAGSECTVVETGTEAFPPDTIVSYSPAAADTTGVLVNENETTNVEVTNTFASLLSELVEVPPNFTG
jgi:hypothetical protein